ncbi:ribonuclease III [Mycoplasma sp. E35C]|uniref:ribonuclease III n=1 Tax=Mycoplasma sp. E35C TaxID=2801918 RepID=UPI001CA40B4F|nr:ribonuclease III [Mycoplasma sp. E35C]QZX48926.1 ribonuclease III [Mycoplasma sp. E35C]
MENNKENTQKKPRKYIKKKRQFNGIKTKKNRDKKVDNSPREDRPVPRLFPMLSTSNKFLHQLGQTGRKHTYKPVPLNDPEYRKKMQELHAQEAKKIRVATTNKNDLKTNNKNKVRVTKKDSKFATDDKNKKRAGYYHRKRIKRNQYNNEQSPTNINVGYINPINSLIKKSYEVQKTNGLIGGALNSQTNNELNTNQDNKQFNRTNRVYKRKFTKNNNETPVDLNLNQNDANTISRVKRTYRLKPRGVAELRKDQNLITNNGIQDNLSDQSQQINEVKTVENNVVDLNEKNEKYTVKIDKNEDQSTVQVKPRRGRKPGSKNKTATVEIKDEIIADTPKYFDVPEAIQNEEVTIEIKDEAIQSNVVNKKKINAFRLDPENPSQDFYLNRFKKYVQMSETNSGDTKSDILKQKISNQSPTFVNKKVDRIFNNQQSITDQEIGKIANYIKDNYPVIYDDLKQDNLNEFNNKGIDEQEDVFYAKEEPDDINLLLKKFKITTDKTAIYEQALTHNSYSNERKLDYNYQRLEFLGDAIINKVVAEYLFNQADSTEGEMTKDRIKIIQSKTLIKAAKQLGLVDYVKVGFGVKSTALSPKILEDIFESFIGALYLDQGEYAVRKILQDTIIGYHSNGELIETIDYKSIFQEIIHSTGLNMKIYYDKRFDQENNLYSVNLYAGGIMYGQGTDINTHRAEIRAAKDAISKFHGLLKI